MNFKQVIQALESNYSIQLISSNFTLNIQDIQLINSDISVWADNILYIGDGRLIGDGSLIGDVNFIGEDTLIDDNNLFDDDTLNDYDTLIDNDTLIGDSNLIGVDNLIGDSNLIGDDYLIGDNSLIGNGKLIKNNSTKPKQMLLMDDTLSAEKYKNQQELNLALFPKEQLYSLFNYINSLFLSSLKITNQFNQLIALSLKGESQHEIVNAAAEIIKNPIIIVDTSFKVLSYSTKYHVKDEIWVDNIKRGYCTYDFLVLATELAPKQKAPDNSEAYDIYCPISPTSKFGSKIYWNNTHIGYTLLFEEYTPISFNHKDFLPFVSYIMSDLLSKNPDFEGIYSPISEKILNNILKGENAGYVQTLLHYTNIKFPETMVCIVLELSRHNQIKFMYDQLKEQLRHIFPTNCITVYDNNLVCMAPTIQNDDLPVMESNQLKNLFHNDVLSITISSSFSELLQGKKYYNQCVKLQEISHKMNIKNDILFYKDYVLYSLLLDMDNETILLDKVHNALPILREYDQKNSSNLYQTLCVYISSNNNLKESASKLFVHRNSLSYRLNKIVDLTGIDFNNVTTLFHLNLSYSIERFLKIADQ